MNRIGSFARMTLQGGLFVVLPVVLVVFLTTEAVDMVLALLQSVAEMLPVRDLVGLEAPRLLALLIIVATCFLTGLAVSTRPGEWLERRLLRPLPAYSTLQNLTKRFTGTGDGLEFSPALARIHGPDSLSLCFVVEEHGDGMVTVFVPVSPTPTVGFVYLIEADKIEPLDVPMGPAVNCAMQWGIGLRRLRERGSATD